MPVSSDIYATGVGGLGRLSINPQRIQFSLPTLQDLAKVVRERLKPYQDLEFHLHKNRQSWKETRNEEFIPVYKEAGNDAAIGIFQANGKIKTHKPVFLSSGGSTLVYDVVPRAEGEKTTEVLKMRMFGATVSKNLIRDLIHRAVSEEISKLFLFDGRAIIKPPHMPTVKNVKDTYWFEAKHNKNLSLEKLRFVVFLEELNRMQASLSTQQMKKIMIGIYESNNHMVPVHSNETNEFYLHSIESVLEMKTEKAKEALALTKLSLEKMKDVLAASEQYYTLSSDLVIRLQNGFNISSIGAVYDYPGQGLNWAKADITEEEIHKEIAQALGRAEDEGAFNMHLEQFLTHREGLDSNHGQNQFFVPAEGEIPWYIQEIDN